MSPVRIASWSNVLPARTSLVPYREGIFREPAAGPFIARGAGRSFGDAAYVGGGVTVCSAGGGASRRLAPDLETITCDAGVSIGELQEEVERAGRYLAVFGGTRWATAGGAVAADIHSKADPDEGSCGNHVEALTLVTPDGVARRCSRGESPELFAAAVGGMGMAGYIADVTFRLLPPRPLGVRIRGQIFRDISELRGLFDATRADLRVCEWVDLSGPSPRGILWYARYVEEPVRPPRAASNLWLPRVRAFRRASVRLIERATLTAAARLDLVTHRRRFHFGSAHETLKNWNRLFGRRGFIEYHYCVPDAALEETFRALLGMRKTYGAHLFFAAGKRFGAHARAGLISFPAEGWGINFQAPNSEPHRRLLADFTDAVTAAGGRVYLAKDSVITPRQFERMYARLPEWRRVLRRYDPDKRVQSDLSRRLELKPW